MNGARKRNGVPRSRQTPERFKSVDEFLIDIDTREQLAYDFLSINSFVLPFATQLATLATGDYGPSEYRGEMMVERKTKQDAYGSFGGDRERFEAEIVRMAGFKFAAVVIEAEWSEMFNSPPVHSIKMNPKSIMASCVAWSQRYGVHFYAVPGRAFAEKLTFRLIERYVRDRRNAQTQQAPKGEFHQ